MIVITLTDRTRAKLEGVPVSCTAITEMNTLFAHHGRRRALRTGDVLFHETDASNQVYLCSTGRVRLVVAGACGRELMLDVKLPGDVFGEMSAIDGCGRATTAVAMDPTEVIEVSGDRFLEALLGDPSATLAALRGLSFDLRKANARITAGETEPVVTRAARLLLELTERFTNDGADHLVWTVPMTQADLAEWLGATRETTARSLATLRRAGLISTGRNRVTVHDRTALAIVARPA